MAPLESDFMNLYVDTEQPRWPEFRPDEQNDVPVLENEDDDGGVNNGNVQDSVEQISEVEQEGQNNKRNGGEVKIKNEEVQTFMSEYFRSLGPERLNNPEDLETFRKVEESYIRVAEGDQTTISWENIAGFDEYFKEHSKGVHEEFIGKFRDVLVSIVKRNEMQKALNEVKKEPDLYDETVANDIENEIKKRNEKIETKKRVLGMYKEMGKIDEKNIMKNRLRPKKAEPGLSEEIKKRLGSIREIRAGPIDRDAETKRIKRKQFDTEVIIDEGPYNNLIYRLEDAHENSDSETERERLRIAINNLYERIEKKFDPSASQKEQKDFLKERMSQSKFLLANLDLFGDDKVHVQELAYDALRKAELLLYDMELEEVFPDSPPPKSPPKTAKRVTPTSVITQTLRNLPPDPLAQEYDPKSVAEPEPSEGDLLVKGGNTANEPKKIYGLKTYRFATKFRENPNSPESLEFAFINNENQALEKKYDEYERITTKQAPSDSEKRKANSLHRYLFNNSAPFPDMDEKEEKSVKQSESFNSREELRRLDEIREKNRKDEEERRLRLEKQSQRESKDDPFSKAVRQSQRKEKKTKKPDFSTFFTDSTKSKK
jgi:hypothetical protein